MGEAINAQRTTSEIAQMFGVHANLVGSRKKLAPTHFLNSSRRRPPTPLAPPYRVGRASQIARMTVEMDFPEKKHRPVRLRIVANGSTPPTPI